MFKRFSTAMVLIAALLAGCQNGSQVLTNLNPEEIQEVFVSEKPVSNTLKLLFANGVCPDVEGIWNAALDVDKDEGATSAFVQACQLFGPVLASMVPISSVVYDNPVEGNCNRVASAPQVAAPTAYEAIASKVCM